MLEKRWSFEVWTLKFWLAENNKIPKIFLGIPVLGIPEEAALHFINWFNALLDGARAVWICWLLDGHNSVTADASDLKFESNIVKHI